MVIVEPSRATIMPVLVIVPPVFVAAVVIRTPAALAVISVFFVITGYISIISSPNMP
jgi:hypothetical protein